VYKVINAIFHRGSYTENGHFTNIYREGLSSIWIETDDVHITKKQWGAKDIYILFLEKVDNK